MREQILALRSRRRVESVKTPHGEVYVRELSARERDYYEASLVRDRGKIDLKGATARLLGLVLCDRDGTALFGPDDADSLNDLPASFVAPVLDVARRLNGWEEREFEELVGELKKTSNDA